MHTEFIYGECQSIYCIWLHLGYVRDLCISSGLEQQLQTICDASLRSWKSPLHLELLLQGFFVSGVVDVAVRVLRRVVHLAAPALERQVLAEPDRKVGLEAADAEEESVTAVW